MVLLLVFQNVDPDCLSWQYGRIMATSALGKQTPFLVFSHLPQKKVDIDTFDSNGWYFCLFFKMMTVTVFHGGHTDLSLRPSSSLSSNLGRTASFGSSTNPLSFSFSPDCSPASFFPKHDRDSCIERIQQP